MTSLRRRLSHALARWAVRIDPDPPLVFTTRHVRDLDFLIDEMGDRLGGLGLGLGPDHPGPSGTIARL